MKYLKDSGCQEGKTAALWTVSSRADLPEGPSVLSPTLHPGSPGPDGDAEKGRNGVAAAFVPHQRVGSRVPSVALALEPLQDGAHVGKLRETPSGVAC